MLDALAEAAPTSETVALAVVCFLAGAAVPTYYAQERFRGFGRAVVDRLPYRPPPGMDEEQALAAALESAEEQCDPDPDGEENA